MNSHLIKDWEQISQSFSLSTTTDKIEIIASGLINDSFLIQEKDLALVLQRINTSVFTQPDAIQANFEKVSAHLKNQNYPYELLSTVKTKEQQPILHIDDNVWRLMPFIDNSTTITKVESAEQAYSAAKMVGTFDRELSDLDANDFYMTIPGFHDLDGRLVALKKTLTADSLNRAKQCSKELEVIERFKELSRWQSANLANGNLKIKVTHNDTKITNQLFDKETRIAKALIDWDTIMPGCWLYDYADMVRSFVPSQDEESKSNSALQLQGNILQAVTEGYLDAIASEITLFERKHLLTSVQLIFLMLGVRFLTDFLDGDNYFKTEFELQNLQRCRNQFSLLLELADDLEYWNKLIGV